MRILLLGGTGAIGENLVKILEEKSIETVVTSRMQRKPHGSIVYAHGNARDIQFLKQLSSDYYDAIVDFMSYKTEEYASRVDIFLQCTNQYVFISSARVYANNEHPIKEMSPRLLDVCKDANYLRSDEYALTKARQEDILRSHSIRNNYTIVRPYITYSSNRLQLGVLEKEEWLYRALSGHTIVFTKEIADRMTTMTSGSDVAQGIFNLLGNKAAFGEAIHLTGSHPRTWNDIINIYSSTFKDITGCELKIKMVSLNVFLNCRNKGLEWQVLYDRLYDRVFDTTKETFLSGSESFESPEIGLRKCLTEFLISDKKFKTINFKNEGKKDKITKDFFQLSTLPTIKQKVLYLLNRFKL